MQFIQNNNIINTTQYGFLKKHNTTQATLDIYNHIMENKKENKAINTLFLDLSKAFDTVMIVYCSNYNGIDLDAKNG